MSPEPLVRVEALSCAQRTERGPVRVLSDVTLEIAPGEVLGLAGESGSGKSTLAHLLLGYRLGRLVVQAGQVRFAGRDLLALPRPALDRLRGDRVALVPQNPTTALDPRLPVGRQVAEALATHKHGAGSARVQELLDEVGLPNPRAAAKRYPHQLSGGQQQRVVLAMALSCRPDLLVLDEPTTGLDVTTQARIIALLRDLRARHGMAMLYVTHDLGVMGQIADRVGILYAGHLVEVAHAARLFRVPRHPYSRGLIASVPRLGAAAVPAEEPLYGLLRRAELPQGCPFAPRCPHAEPTCAVEPQHLAVVAADHAVACRRWPSIEPTTARRGAEPARHLPSSEAVLELRSVALDYRRGFVAGGATPPMVDGIDLLLPRGETLALVGESGSGKSTIARAIAGLLPPASGTMLFAGHTLPPDLAARTPAQRRAIQFVFQNPDASLNPRTNIGETLGRPLAFFDRVPARTLRERVAVALEEVQLDPGYAARYPDELSGGERQRIAIARALIVDPALLLCDEVLSALDVSVQARVLDLLHRLRRERHQTMLFISHDLAVVRALADRVAVLYRGRLMQAGPAEAVFRPPFHPYTLALLAAVPELDRPFRPFRPLGADAVATSGPGTSVVGCAFVGRCPWQRGALCETTAPPRRATGAGGAIHCHIPLDELAALTSPARAAAPTPTLGHGATP